MPRRSLIGLLLLSFCLNVDAQNPGWTPFYHRDYTIVYPSNWELDTSGQMRTSFFLFSPVTGEKDDFKENVNLMIQDLSQYPATLDQYIKLTVDQIASMEDIYMKKNERKKAGNRSFQHLVYSGSQGGYDLVFEQYIWVIHKEAFVLTFTCQESMYETYREIGQKVMNSFRIKK